MYIVQLCTLDASGIFVSQSVKLFFATGAPVNSEHQPSSPDLTTVVFQFLFPAVELKGLPFFLIVCGYFNDRSVITEYPPNGADFHYRLLSCLSSWT